MAGSGASFIITESEVASRRMCLSCPRIKKKTRSVRSTLRKFVLIIILKKGLDEEKYQLSKEIKSKDGARKKVNLK